jgi:hypothetical protein
MFNPAGIRPSPRRPRRRGPNQKVVDGTQIYLGVSRKGGDTHQVTITLRDATSHAPIEGAQVEAKVTNPVMGAETASSPAEGGDVVSYAADFRMTGKEPHVITCR